ncbi:MAG: phenylalanine--tRNA ligase subunit beta [Verrucomicrobia bacterium]|nr:MAG: phenylalanine--tRNA ligase subunit beta [Verrucomicrobiota bacterium]
MAQQVASVWRDFDIENRVARKEIGKRRADLCFGCQNQKSGRIVADAELDWAAKHSFRFDTAEFAFSNLSSARQLRARQRKRNFVANLVIGRATNDLAFRSAAIIDFADRQAIRVRMARRSGDLRNDHVIDLCAARFDVLGFDAGAGQQFRDLFRIFWKIDNVKVGPSPQWLRGKIESVGIRSINNIVDISNFVMLELGQPTHAFDADRLRGGINVRLGREGEKFLALDGKTYSLTPDSCVVADQERAVGIGGVMGGEETGVTDSTKNILLEAAYFLPASIRRTARELNLPSDASYRFERGVDPEMVLRASQRATELIREIAGGTPGKEINVAGKLPANPPDVSLSCEKCNRVIGITLKPKTVDEILGGFGLRKMSAAKTAKWKIPSYRRDLQRDVDLIEEVVRAYGADKIPGTDRSRFTPASIADHAHDLESAWRERLAAVGLDEVRTSKLLPRERFAFSESAIELRNPLSEDHVALRPSILAGLLGVLDRNIRAGAERVAIFEIGRTFIPPSGKEERHVGILLWGNVASAPNWRSPKSRGLDLFDLKGALECVAPNLSFRQGKFPDLALPVDVFSSDRMIGFGGQLLAAKSTAPSAVFVAEVHADLLLTRNELATKFRDIEKFPAVTRDIAMIVPEETSHQKILRAIEEPREPLLEHVELFDLFSGGEIEAGRKSLAYRLTYRDRSRTLRSEEVNAAHAKIRERLRRDLGAELRE